jgi:hypothetical protein
MKKLGTPIGAGPGSDSEKDGFEAEGTPLPLGSWACLDLALCDFFLAEAVVVVECDEPFCF